MSEFENLSPPSQNAAKAAGAGVPSGGAGRSTSSWLALFAVLLSLIALIGAAWLYVNAEALRQTVGEKLADSGAQNSQNSAALKQLQAQFIESQSRVAQLEGKLAEVQTQRIALEEMSRELARTPDDWLLAEVEQTLNIAAQQLQLAGNVRAAVMALQTADARLARADKTQTLPLRRAINQDLEKLKAQPLVDASGISIKLDSLVNLVDSLPLIVAESAPTARSAEKQDAAPQGWLQRVSRDFWEEIRQLVRIREIEGVEPALLTPTQSYFLRENLKLRLLSARHAMLARDETSYKEDLKQAREWLNRYFDPKAKVNVASSALLKQLLESAISIAVPDINTSINAVRLARTAREKPAR